MWWTQTHSYRNALLTSPNDEIFPINNTWVWAANFTGTYELPFGVLGSAFYQGKTGLLGTRSYAFPQVDPDGGPSLPSSTTITIPMEEANSQKGPAVHLVNVRLSKRFDLGRTRLSADLDWYNVTNSSLPTAISFATGPTFGRVTGIVDSRIARVGLRFSF